jgi:hypothetical protein
MPPALPMLRPNERPPAEKLRLIAEPEYERTPPDDGAPREKPDDGAE